LSLWLKDEFSDLSGVDTDGDGETDQAEGYGDQDGDGIPNYLDSNKLPSHQLSQQPEDGWGYLLETEPGLRLELGDIAFYHGGTGARITWDDFLNVVQNGFGASTDVDGSLFDAGIYSFQIAGLVNEGDSAKVVIPQRQAIGAEPVLYKLMPQGWGLFVEDELNGIQSAPGEAGICPSPIDESYTDGMQAGYWCLVLTIEDGGPNDADVQADGKVVYTGGVSRALDGGNSTEEGVTGEEDAAEESGNGGGGLLSMWALLVLSGMMLKRFCVGMCRPMSRAVVPLDNN
jgi:large repetitive protein